MMRLAAIPTGLSLLAGCVTAPASERPLPASEGQCDATSLSSAVENLATSDLGAHLLAESGARSLRWIPPRSAVTMDYRSDRLNITYDDDYRITRIYCG